MEGVTEPCFRDLVLRLHAPSNLGGAFTEFVRVTLAREGSQWVATAARAQGSGILTSLAAGAGLLVGPAAVTRLEAGEVHPVIVPSATALATADPVALGG